MRNDELVGVCAFFVYIQIILSLAQLSYKFKQIE